VVRLAVFASLRKLVHIGGVLFVPLALYNQYLALAMAVLGTLVFIIFERQKRRVVPGFFRYFYRQQELSTVAMEPLAYLLSLVALLALSIIFMPMACYVAIIVMTVGDGCAALAGRWMHGPKLPYSRKTWYGSLAGIIVSGIVGYLIAGPVAIVGAACGMAVEAYAGKHDNAITAAVALVCTILAFTLFPGLAR
jgi:dolichol kinase